MPRCGFWCYESRVANQPSQPRDKVMKQLILSGLLIAAFGFFAWTVRKYVRVMLLGRKDERPRFDQLARRAGVTKQAMMQMVDDLEEGGFVRRTPDPEDARAKAVRLTARGVRQRALARQAVQMVESRIRRELGPRRYAALRSALEDLTVREE